MAVDGSVKQTGVVYIRLRYLFIEVSVLEKVFIEVCISALSQTHQLWEV